MSVHDLADTIRDTAFVEKWFSNPADQKGFELAAQAAADAIEASLKAEPVVAAKALTPRTDHFRTCLVQECVYMEGSRYGLDKPHAAWCPVGKAMEGEG